MILPRKAKQMIKLGTLTIGIFSGICIYKNDARFYKDYVMPLVHVLDPEQGHKFSIFVNKFRLIPKSKFEDPQSLEVTIFGRKFKNPIGIAAGYDKNAEAVEGLQDIGFGFIEVGSVTPHPQEGNEKPRVFRLKADKAVINRYGFNSDGHELVLRRIYELREKNFNGIIGVNLGKNKTSVSPAGDYVKGVMKFGPVADYLVINISSPNTPGLRNLQQKQYLRDLLKPVVQAARTVPNKPALLLKLAPDLTYEERKDIADVINNQDCHVDGLIICNTTIARPDSLNSKKLANELGGLSGEPLKDISSKMIADMHRLTQGLPIIGVGGISSGKDALDKIKAGASLVQIYTVLVYEGPPVVTEIKKNLVELLAKEGFENINEAVGKAAKTFS